MDCTFFLNIYFNVVYVYVTLLSVVCFLINYYCNFYFIFYFILLAILDPNPPKTIPNNSKSPSLSPISSRFHKIVFPDLFASLVSVKYDVANFFHTSHNHGKCVSLCK